MRSPAIIGIIGIVAALAMAAPAARAAGTVVLASGGQNFQAYGPAAYWRYVNGEGYCGRIAAWCSPKQFQWTYVVRTFGATNWALWTNPYPVDYSSRASAFIPGRDATATVEYTINYGYAYSHAQAIVDQLPYYNVWVPLNPGSSYVRIRSVDLSDASFWGTGSAKVAFDEIKIEN